MDIGFELAQVTDLNENKHPENAEVTMGWRVADKACKMWHNSHCEYEFVIRTECVWAQELRLKEGYMAEMPLKETILMATLKIVIVKIYLYVCGIRHWKKWRNK